MPTVPQRPPPLMFASRLGDLAYWNVSSSKPSAPTLVLLHGWPFNAFSFRNLLPLLTPNYNCVLLDWPGLGESILHPGKADQIGFRSLAAVLGDFLVSLDAQKVAIVAHDTGATIARLALAEGAPKVSHLICLSTEIPGHHLALISRLQKLFRNPVMPWIYAQLLKSRGFLRSGQGFATCVVDPEHLDETFAACFTRPLSADRRKRDGMIAYLNGIDWTVVGDLHATQARIRQPATMIWGAEDQIFPADLARASASSFAGGCTFTEIPGAGFLALEEHPAPVAAAIIAFLGEGSAE